LAPLVITRFLGEAFRPAGKLLPLFAVLAVSKGVEVVLYRLLYAVRRQGTYMGAWPSALCSSSCSTTR